MKRNTTGLDVLLDIKRVADDSGQAQLTVHEYEKAGNVSLKIVLNRFGTWNQACEHAGLVPHCRPRRRISDQDLCEDLKRVAKKLKTRWVTLMGYKTHGEFGGPTIQQRFGSWKSAHDQAGLDSSLCWKVRKERFPHAALIKDLRRVATKRGQDWLTYDQYKNDEPMVSLNTFKRKFGTWNKAVVAARLKPTQPGGFPNYDNELLLKALVSLSDKLGIDHFTGDQYRRNRASADPSLETITDSFHWGWSGALKAASKYREGAPVKKEWFHTTRRKASREQKVEVWQRDGSRCQGPGCTAEYPNIGMKCFQNDHVIPFTRGGETTVENLQLLCSSCNSRKSNEAK